MHILGNCVNSLYIWHRNCKHYLAMNTFKEKKAGLAINFIISKAALFKLLYVLIIFIIVVKPTYGKSKLTEFKKCVELLFNEPGQLQFKTERNDKRYNQYLDFYSLYNKGVKNYFGIFNSTGFDIFAQVFVPQKSRGTAIIIHGYLDHSGNQNNLINSLIDTGYAVALFDLPGHGLSSGERTDIKDFTQYVSVFQDFYSIIKKNLQGEIHLIGHSTGCSIIFDSLHHNRYKPYDFGKIIFVAPLVRSYKYKLSKFGFPIAKLFVSGFQRDFSKGPSNDPEYCRFIEHDDPLQGRKVQTGWLSAMFSWNKRVEKFNRIKSSVLIYQGEMDRVVDYKYNIDFFREKVEVVNAIYFKRGKHHLLNEAKDIKNKIISGILAYIEDK